MDSTQGARFDFLQAIERDVTAALEENDPVVMRALAERINNASAAIRDRLSGLQGKLNAKAFGR